MCRQDFVPATHSWQDIRLVSVPFGNDGEELISEATCCSLWLEWEIVFTPPSVALAWMPLTNKHHCTPNGSCWVLTQKSTEVVSSHQHVVNNWSPDFFFLFTVSTSRHVGGLILITSCFFFYFRAAACKDLIIQTWASSVSDWLPLSETGSWPVGQFPCRVHVAILLWSQEQLVRTHPSLCHWCAHKCFSPPCLHTGLLLCLCHVFAASLTLRT